MTYPNDQRALHSIGNYDRVQVAVITAVSPSDGTVSLAFTDQFGFRDKVPLPVLAMSKDAWIRFIPQVNDVVLVGLRGDDSASILGWHPWGYRARARAFEASDLNAVEDGDKGPEMMQVLKPGEIDVRASGGGYLRLNNIGDVLLMGLSGRIHVYGIESLIEVAANASKLTDGQSWLRFGKPFRFYPAVSEREMPSSGGGQPANTPPSWVERDTRIVGANGQLLVHEGLGTVLDETGSMELSGTTGGGAFTKQTLPGAGRGTKGFNTNSFADIKARVSQTIGNLADEMRVTGNTLINQILNSVAGIGASDGLSSLPTTVRDAARGDGGFSALNSIGKVGRELRYRLHVFKGSNQVAAFDVDEEGGCVLTSSDEEGLHLNAPKGGLQLTSKKSIVRITKGIMDIAEEIFEQAKNNLRQIVGGTARRVAGVAIKDNAPEITRVAETSISDKALTIVIEGTSGVTIKSSGVVTVQGTTILLN